MHRTHRSLYYLVSYLSVAGLALFAIVAVGVVFTGYSYLQDRGAKGA
jgi:hypothetical protein